MTKKFITTRYRRSILQNHAFNGDVQYYQAHVQFLNDNHELLGLEDWKSSALKNLMKINPIQYINPNRDAFFTLPFLEQRFLSMRDLSVPDLIDMIEGTLWSVVSIDSSRGCPRMGEGELYFIRMVHGDASQSWLMQCPQCGYVGDLAGQDYTGQYGDVFPVTQFEYEQYIVPNLLDEYDD